MPRHLSRAPWIGAKKAGMASRRLWLRFRYEGAVVYGRRCTRIERCSRGIFSKNDGNVNEAGNMAGFPKGWTTVEYNSGQTLLVEGISNESTSIENKNTWTDQCLNIFVHIQWAGKVLEPDASTQRIFDQGHLVGELAKNYSKTVLNVRRRFRGKICGWLVSVCWKKAAFQLVSLHKSIYSRLDVLRPGKQRKMDIIEVKSTQALKKSIYTMGFQKLCARRMAFPSTNAYLACIKNNQYVRNGR